MTTTEGESQHCRLQSERSHALSLCGLTIIIFVQNRCRCCRGGLLHHSSGHAYVHGVQYHDALIHEALPAVSIRRFCTR